MTCRAFFAVLFLGVSCVGVADAQGSEVFTQRLARLPAIRGVAYSPSYPGISDPTLIPMKIYRQDLQRIRRAGFNTIRTYDPLPEPVMEIARSEGLSVIEGVLRLDDRIDYGSDRVVAQLVDQAVRRARERKHHPHILYWCLWNDVPFHWGVADGNAVRKYGYERMDQVLGRIAAAVRAEDPDRPLTGAYALNAPGLEVGMTHLDLVSLNVYPGIIDWTSGTFEASRIRSALERVVELGRKVGRPVLVSETGYSSYMPLDRQGRAVPAQVEAIRQAGLGYILFQWQDEWTKAGTADRQAPDIETHWGIVDAYRRPKSGYGPIVRAVRGRLVRRRDTAESAGETAGRSGGTILIEGYDYRDTEELTRAYWERAHSRVRYATRLSGTSADGSLSVIWHPRDAGAWSHIQRRWDKGVDLSGASALSFKARGSGGEAAVSVMLIDADAERYRGDAVIVGGAVSGWRHYHIDLGRFYRDEYGLEVSGPSGGNGQWDRSDVRGLAIKISDIPYSETPGTRMEIEIDDVRVS